MKLLAIDTSSAALSIAACADGNISERLETAPRQHAEKILQFIDSVLADLNIELTELDAIAYGYGPGSFTSLRIGLGVVQGLALGADLRVIPVSSLLTVAQAATPAEKQHSLVCMDARMGEVYTAACVRNASGLMQRVSAEKVCPPADVNIPDTDDWIALGNGFSEYRDQLPSIKQVITDCWPLATAMLALAKPQLEAGNTLDAAEVLPRYVRNKVAKTIKERQ
ncbi:MAG: tRNA (adenosine(37)-N6)-threonylcarbamoyltransferase complex dimerization subunit type 1 TsaB [Xanthomonadales bacterium]|nr:tRNA (adenosine(37)-N6)-threonylcarbamoyltransferase complex dimerization subunit type 1 TsaB [Xanthomonadales bacterium]